ncbi:cell division protein ZapA [Antarcticirhabdus aurantiaca]|uniref:Cell division protein ZapA n=1 Tax=Antarcticirhabdus aurantiaca TaxID=2606717 RepID=A0ACD4NTJ1_9HYPH|nr:cell division protein ZapA [Antarcticirhabdus aurantiaca]WAJ30241.1 cell division protein ZapA [Jeongeuplla avenae]
MRHVPQVVVTIDSKTYRMACGEGEEDHLLNLAAEIDRRVGELRSSFGEIGDLRLTVMTAMMIADELQEANKRLSALSSDARSADQRKASFDEALTRERAAMAVELTRVAEAVEEMERRLRPRGNASASAQPGGEPAG